MKALTYIEHGKFALTDKPKPELLDPRDAIVFLFENMVANGLIYVNRFPGRIVL